MNIKGIVTHLGANIPKYTNEFSEYENLVSGVIQFDKRTILATTATAHNLVIDNYVIITNAEVKNNISAIVVNDGIATITTLAEHDYNYNPTLAQHFEIAGSETAWNGIHQIYNIPNRNEIQIELDETAPTTLGYIWENRDLGANGISKILTTPTTTTFTYKIDDNAPGLPETELRNAEMTRGTRIAGVANPERAIKIYTETSAQRKPWLFVMLPDDTVSKDQHALSDAVATFDNSTSGRLRILNNFDVVAILPTTNLGGVEEIEKCNGDIKNALISTLFGLRSEENVDIESSYRAVYNGSATFGYDTATYIRMYSFQIPEDITLSSTESDKPLSVALRDAVLKMTYNTTTQTTNINLDEEV